jgi:hypothetical protein
MCQSFPAFAERLNNLNRAFILIVLFLTQTANVAPGLALGEPKDDTGGACPEPSRGLPWTKDSNDGQACWIVRGVQPRRHRNASGAVAVLAAGIGGLVLVSS